MDSLLAAFGKVAPYLKHPLVLVGFVLFLFFGIYRQLIESGIIPPLDQQAGSTVVQTILEYGFWINTVRHIYCLGSQYCSSFPVKRS